MKLTKFEKIQEVSKTVDLLKIYLIKKQYRFNIIRNIEFLEYFFIYIYIYIYMLMCVNTKIS